MPCAMAGQMVYLAMWRRTVVVGDSYQTGHLPVPRERLITCAVCQVRSTTSPTRPIAWESLPIIEIAPISCNTSSAAIGRSDPAYRQTRGLRDPGVEVVAHHQHVEMSSRVFTVCGRVGLGVTFDLRRDGNECQCVPPTGVVGVNQTSGDRAPMVSATPVIRSRECRSAAQPAPGVATSRCRWPPGSIPIFVEFETPMRHRATVSHNSSGFTVFPCRAARSSRPTVQ